MLAIAFAVLGRVWPYLLGAALLLGGYWALDHWHNAAWQTANARADAAETKLAAAQKRATDLALLWSAQVDKSDKEARDAKAKAVADYVRQQDVVRHLSVLPTLRISADAWRVLVDATDFANAAASPSVNQNAPQAISEAALGQYALDAADAYLDARAHWSSCVSFYESLQNVPIH